MHHMSTDEAPRNFVPINPHLVESISFGKMTGKVAVDNIPHSVAPDAKPRVENWIRFLLQNQARQTAMLVDLLFRGLSNDATQRTVAAITAHLQTTQESIAMIHQIVTEGERRIAVASATDLDQLKLPEKK